MAFPTTTTPTTTTTTAADCYTPLPGSEDFFGERMRTSSILLKEGSIRTIDGQTRDTVHLWKGAKGDRHFTCCWCDWRRTSINQQHTLSSTIIASFSSASKGIASHGIEA